MCRGNTGGWGGGRGCPPCDEAAEGLAGRTVAEQAFPAPSRWLLGSRAVDAESNAPQRVETAEEDTFANKRPPVDRKKTVSRVGKFCANFRVLVGEGNNHARAVPGGKIEVTGAAPKPPVFCGGPRLSTLKRRQQRPPKRRAFYGVIYCSAHT